MKAVLFINPQNPKNHVRLARRTAQAFNVAICIIQGGVNRAFWPNDDVNLGVRGGGVNHAVQKNGGVKRIPFLLLWGIGLDHAHRCFGHIALHFRKRDQGADQHNRTDTRRRREQSLSAQSGDQQQKQGYAMWSDPSKETNKRALCQCVGQQSPWKAREQNAAQIFRQCQAQDPTKRPKATRKPPCSAPKQGQPPRHKNERKRRHEPRGLKINQKGFDNPVQRDKEISKPEHPTKFHGGYCIARQTKKQDQTPNADQPKRQWRVAKCNTAP